MAGIADYSTSAASNTTVGGVNIQGSAPASNLDNGLRAIMADIASALLAGTFSATGYVTKSAGYTVAVTDRGKLIDCTSSLELALPAAATAKAGFAFWVKANGAAATINPDASENINGASATITVPNGSTVLVVCDGTGWQTGFNGLATLLSPAFLTSFSVSSTATGAVGTLLTTEAGASYGPVLRFDRDSASPAANDLGGAIEFRMRDATPNALEVFAQITAAIITATATAEDGAIAFSTVRSGAVATRWILGGGFYKAGNTDPGAGNISADNYYIGSAAIQATQSDMETGTSTSLVSTPGRQHFHPGHPKFWAWVSQSGATPSLTTSYNVTSITDTGTGQLTVTIDTDFSSANWCCVATSANGTNATAMTQNTKAAGSVLVMHNGGSNDPSAGWNVLGLGDQT